MVTLVNKTTYCNNMVMLIKQKKTMSIQNKNKIHKTHTNKIIIKITIEMDIITLEFISTSIFNLKNFSRKIHLSTNSFP